MLLPNDRKEFGNCPIQELRIALRDINIALKGNKINTKNSSIGNTISQKTMTHIEAKIPKGNRNIVIRKSILKLFIKL